MSYKKQVWAWLQTAPQVEIRVGAYTLKYCYGYDRDWGTSWVCWGEPDWEDTPESNYFNEICHAMSGSCHDMGFIDELLEAMNNKPFNQGESK